MRAEMLLGESGESLYTKSEEERDLPVGLLEATDSKPVQK